MADNNNLNDHFLERFRGIVKEEISSALKPISQDLKIIAQDLKTLHQTQDEHTSKLDSLSLEVSEMHQEIGALNDRTKLYYENNKRDINEIRQKLGMPKSPSLTEAADYPS